MLEVVLPKAGEFFKCVIVLNNEVQEVFFLGRSTSPRFNLRLKFLVLRSLVMNSRFASVKLYGVEFHAGR